MSFSFYRGEPLLCHLGGSHSIVDPLGGGLGTADLVLLNGRPQPTHLIQKGIIYKYI